MLKRILILMLTAVPVLASASDWRAEAKECERTIKHDKTLASEAQLHSTDELTNYYIRSLYMGAISNNPTDESLNDLDPETADLTRKLLNKDFQQWLDEKAASEEELYDQYLHRDHPSDEAVKVANCHLIEAAVPGTDYNKFLNSYLSEMLSGFIKDKQSVDGYARNMEVERIKQMKIAEAKEQQVKADKAKAVQLKQQEAKTIADAPTAQVGYFEVKALKCYSRESVGTVFPFHEPEHWAGSKFLIIDASFKNTDSEGRLPDAGAMLINYHGKVYKYDHLEFIDESGFGINFKSVNPLVTLRTKLIYRIPSEIAGQVYWQPGRNANNVNLSCGSI